MLRACDTGVGATTHGRAGPLCTSITILDIYAHALWAGAGVTLARCRWTITPRIVAMTVALAALPDVLHLLPLAGWWAFGDGTLATIWGYAIAVPVLYPFTERSAVRVVTPGSRACSA